MLLKIPAKKSKNCLQNLKITSDQLVLANFRVKLKKRKWTLKICSTRTGTASEPQSVGTCPSAASTP